MTWLVGAVTVVTLLGVGWGVAIAHYEYRRRGG